MLTLKCYYRIYELHMQKLEKIKLDSNSKKHKPGKIVNSKVPTVIEQQIISKTLLPISHKVLKCPQDFSLQEFKQWNIKK